MILLKKFLSNLGAHVALQRHTINSTTADMCIEALDKLAAERNVSTKYRSRAKTKILRQGQHAPAVEHRTKLPLIQAYCKRKVKDQILEEWQQCWTQSNTCSQSKI